MLLPGQAAVQAHRWTVLALIVRAVVVWGRPARHIHRLVPGGAVGMGPHVEGPGSGLVVRTREAGAAVGVGVD